MSFKEAFKDEYIEIDISNNEEAKAFDEVKEQVYQTYLMVKRQEKYLEKLNKISKDVEVKKYY